MFVASFILEVSHIINIPRLLGLYGENIGPLGLGSRAIGTEGFLTQFIRSIIVKLFNTSGILFNLSIIPVISRAREYLRNSYC